MAIMTLSAGVPSTAHASSAPSTAISNACSGLPRLMQCDCADLRGSRGAGSCLARWGGQQRLQSGCGPGYLAAQSAAAVCP